VAAADELPVACESVDVLILPHLVEFESNRHQVLREAERVLKPEGRLFILGINPWNPHGLAQHLPRDSSAWRSRYVSSHRLLDWLSLLKFEAEFSAAFSVSSSQVLGRPDTLWARTKAELSFAYAVKAIKRRYTLIPLKPQWISAPSLAAGHMFEKFEKPRILASNE
jgi:ubiquinone/menaquinone biosynthesis C-methylase UbiE